MQAPPIGDDCYTVEILETVSQQKRKRKSDEFDFTGALQSMRPVILETFENLRKAGQKKFTVLLDRSSPDTDCFLELDESRLSIFKDGSNARYNVIKFKAKESLALPTSSEVDEDKLTQNLCLFAQSLQNALEERKKPKKRFEGENVFLSGVYASFKLQMIAITDEFKQKYPFLAQDKHFKELLAKIYSDDNTRPHIDQTVTEIREVFDELQNMPNSPLKQLFHKVMNEWVESLYTKINLEDSWQKFLRTLSPKLVAENCKSLVDAMIMVKKELTECGKLDGAIPYPSVDPFSSGNLPSALWSIVNAKGQTSQFVRMANCVMEEGLNTDTQTPLYTIQPEFVAYLKKLQGEGKRFLIINNMCTKGYVKSSKYEAGLTTVIHELETKYGLTNVDVVTLDRNSHFYFGTGSYSDLKNTEIKKSAYFKDFLHMHLFNEFSEYPYRWSTRHNKEKLKIDFRSMIDGIHKKYFNSAETLDEKQRTVFQELLMKDIVTYLLNDATYANYTISCHASMDRGPSLAVLHYWENVLKKGQNKNPVEIMKAVTMFFVNAILIGNRLPHDIRFEIFMGALKLVEEKG